MQNVGSICISQDAWFVVACTANGDYLRGGFGVGSRGVCVWNIWIDVKPLLDVLVFHCVLDLIFSRHDFFTSWFRAGGLEPICLSSPTKLWHFGGWVVWSTTCTCRSWHGCRGHSLQDHFNNLIFFADGIRLSPEPVRWFNLQFAELHQNELTYLARTLQVFLHTGSHAWSTNFSCQV